MPYQDTSPPGQHFMNFSRPLTLTHIAHNADGHTLELTYGFGEYRFTADLARHDSIADLRALADTLENGGSGGTATFSDASGHIRLQLHGDGDTLQFACYDSENPALAWLQGESGRRSTIATLRALSEALTARSRT